MDFSKVDALIDSYLPEMEHTLGRLVQYPSVEGISAGEGAPFGEAVRGVLEESLAISKEMGLMPGNLDGYCGYADLPAGDEMVGVLGHLDVVPVNEEEWNTPPFRLTKVEDRLYGRGTMDDKGPMVMSLYALKALLAAGADLKKTVRFIYGCNEETGMRCMEHYLKCERIPSMGFTPDAEWPLIIGEKGIYHFRLEKSWTGEAAADLPILVSLESGTATNIVPAAATAVFEGSLKIPETEGIEVSEKGGKTVITASGISAHGSVPMEGDNAFTKLLRCLNGHKFGPAGAKRYLDTMAALLQDDKYGTDLGVAGRDALSETTCSPNVARIDGTHGSIAVDMRFLLSDQVSKYEEILTKVAAEHGLELKTLSTQSPLYLGEDSELAKKLLESYRDVTGDLSEPMIIGGGTYAKVMPGFLAFGPESIDEPSVIHQSNEYVTEACLLRSAKIYARALYRMACE